MVSKSFAQRFPVPACRYRLAKAAKRCAADFNVLNLSNGVWAFATAGQTDALLFTALLRAAERRMGNFNAQELANTAWAFAMVGGADAALFTAFRKAL